MPEVTSEPKVDPNNGCPESNGKCRRRGDFFASEPTNVAGSQVCWGSDSRPKANLLKEQK